MQNHNACTLGYVDSTIQEISTQVSSTYNSPHQYYLTIYFFKLRRLSYCFRIFVVRECKVFILGTHMGGATIGSGGYKYPPLSKVYPPPGGYRGYKLVARGGYKLTYFGVNFRGSKRRKVSQEKILNHECTVWTVICKNFLFFRRHLETRRLLKTRSLLLEVLRQLDTQLTTHKKRFAHHYKATCHSGSSVICGVTRFLFVSVDLICFTTFLDFRASLSL